MNIDALRKNTLQIKEIVRELYIFTDQYEKIKKLEKIGNLKVNKEEKKLLEEAIDSLTNQLRILINSVPKLVQGIGFYKKLKDEESKLADKDSKEKLVQIEYNPTETNQKVSLVITDKDKKEFLENLSRSNLTIYKLKKKYAIKEKRPDFGKPNLYAKISNRFFRDLSLKLVSKGYFNSLNRDLRKMNSPFVVSTYVSMIFFTTLITFFLSILLLIVLLFYNISVNAPFLTPPPSSDTIILRFLKFVWLIFFIPAGVGLLMYFYPSSEAKNLGSKIDQELPFVAIHMSAIATSGIEPISIFRIILKTEDYKYTNIEFRKLMNLINFHGKDFVTALKETAKSSPSDKLKNMLDGLATTITSGGNLHQYLDKHADSLLFDYKLEREKYTKASETFMNIYISIVIAAPMIFLMLFVIMGSTGTLMNYIGLPVSVLGLLIVLLVGFINIFFLLFLQWKQPKL
ncbi:MAG: type II secretion system F family protein [Candidatus Pacearchaeota archaeon]